MTSPSRISRLPTRSFLSLPRTSMDSTPQTAVLPMPRATTAACEVLPPRLVRIPAAATMPPRSSGLVSRRTKMTSSPRAAHSIAVAESNTTFPTAAPGEAFVPFASKSIVEFAANCGNMSWASWEPLTRSTASSMEMTPSSTNWIAIRNAAPAVRLPTRVCSIHNLWRSMVNSMSQISR